MATTKKSAKTGGIVDVPYEAMTKPQQIATDIERARPDLRPSVLRILDSGLDEAEQVAAMSLFANALHTPGDPNRDPREAIAAAGRGVVPD
jgi:hypothetical protein